MEGHFGAYSLHRTPLRRPVKNIRQICRKKTHRFRLFIVPEKHIFEKIRFFFCLVGGRVGGRAGGVSGQAGKGGRAGAGGRAGGRADRCAGGRLGGLAGERAAGGRGMRRGYCSARRLLPSRVRAAGGSSCRLFLCYSFFVAHSLLPILCCSFFVAHSLLLITPAAGGGF